MKRMSFLKFSPKRLPFFTLAEVLITLTIIGVVAAMTIPTLINNYQKTQYVVGLKKAYTEFNQALQQMALANGCTNDLVCTGLFASGGSTSSQTLGDELVKYFTVAKNCRTNTTTNAACFPINENANDDGTGTNYNYNNDGYYEFITSDGMSILVANFSNDCNTPTWSNNSALGYMTQTCGQVWIDINGLKGPNYYGRDTFFFYITNGKGAQLYPTGGADDKYSGIKFWWNGTSKHCTDSDKDGWYCTGRVMEEGWQMNY